MIIKGKIPLKLNQTQNIDISPNQYFPCDLCDQMLDISDMAEHYHEKHGDLTTAKKCSQSEDSNISLKKVAAVYTRYVEIAREISALRGVANSENLIDSERKKLKGKNSMWFLAPQTDEQKVGNDKSSQNFPSPEIWEDVDLTKLSLRDHSNKRGVFIVIN